MPAKLVRRGFASPFVVTLAVCAPALADPKKPPPPKRAPQPAQQELQWTVTKLPKSKPTECYAFDNASSCPKQDPGKPIPPCNPPPPIKYACPKGFKAGDTLTIVQHKGEVDCFERVDMTCEPGDKCNPPKPRKLACPGS
jgi:hypothetical protein